MKVILLLCNIYIPCRWKSVKNLLNTPEHSFILCLLIHLEQIRNVCSLTADDSNRLMVTISNNEDGGKAFIVIADGSQFSPACDVQSVPMLSWVFTCLTVGYVEGDSSTFVGKVS